MKSLLFGGSNSVSQLVATLMDVSSSNERPTKDARGSQRGGNFVNIGLELGKVTANVS